MLFIDWFIFLKWQQTLQHFSCPPDYKSNLKLKVILNSWTSTFRHCWQAVAVQSNFTSSACHWHHSSTVLVQVRVCINAKIIWFVLCGYVYLTYAWFIADYRRTQSMRNRYCIALYGVFTLQRTSNGTYSLMWNPNHIEKWNSITRKTPL